MWLHNNRRREQGAATVASEIRKHTQGYKVAAAGRQPATENPHFQHLGFALAAAAARKEKPISGGPISVSGNRQCLLVLFWSYRKENATKYSSSITKSASETPACSHATALKRAREGTARAGPQMPRKGTSPHRRINATCWR